MKTSTGSSFAVRLRRWVFSIIDKRDYKLRITIFIFIHLEEGISGLLQVIVQTISGKLYLY